MKLAAPACVAFGLVLLLAAPACRRDARNENPDTGAPDAPSADAPAPVAPATSDAPASPAARPRPTPEEIFRRAFWRHPAPGDRILHAERHDPAAPGGAWRWTLALRPSAELLAALRDPETFNLRPSPPTPPGAAPALPAYPAELPDWFPAPAPGDELLTSPGGNLLVLLRPSEGLLYARDHGSGLAPPVR